MKATLKRIGQRKVIQWCVAYLAGAFVVVQLLDGLESPLGLTRGFQLVVLLVLIVGLPLTAVVAWYHGEQGRQRVTGVELLLISIVVAGGGFLLSQVHWQTTAESVELDPNRIAVIPFSEDGRTDGIGAITRAVTTALIAELDRVPAFEVIPFNTVAQYRAETTSPTQVASELDVGSVISGSLQHFGDSLVAFVQLIDGETGGSLATHMVRQPYSETISLPNDVATEVATVLRQQIGRAVRTRDFNNSMRSAEVRRAMQEANRLRDDARVLRRYGDSVSIAAATGHLDRADSLVAVVRRRDPEWSEPLIVQGWILLDRIGLPYLTDPGQVFRLAGRGIALADTILEKAPESRARALELRGIHRLHAIRSTSEPSTSEAQMQLAESDLREAVRIDPNRPSAWNALSAVLWYQGQFAEAALAGSKALESDAYVEDVEDAVYRLFYAYLQTAEFGEARRWCARGRADYPNDWRFEECLLTLMAYDSTDPSPDVEVAREVLRRVEALSPPEVHQARRGDWLFRVAAIQARAGEADDARATLDSLKAVRMRVPEHQAAVLHEEAYIRLLLGEPERTLELLAAYLEEAPQFRSYVAQDVGFRSLRDDPRFQALIRERNP